MRGQSDKQLVFIYLLAHADADGVAEIIQGKIADDTGLELGSVNGALEELMAPDPASRTDGSDGRRLEPLDDRGWGWSIVNYQHYRGLRDDEERRRQNREAQSRHRSKPPSAAVSQDLLISAQGEGEGEGEVMNLQTCPISSGEELVLPIEDGTCTPSEWAEAHAEFYGAYPRKVQRPDSERAWKKVKPQTHDTFNAIMDGLEVWAGHWALKTDRDKIPYPATWLNAKQWEDQP